MLNDIINRILSKFKHNRYTSDNYINYLRSKGITIGDNCVFYDPVNTLIDCQRPHMISIGSYVKITSGVKILCHDYSRSVFCSIPGFSNVGESGETIIGDNIFIGVNAIVLMGSKIGNNCIIGAGSIVSGCFPDNVVIAGNPARIICSIDEFYKKRKSIEVESAKNFVRCFREKYFRNPDIEDMTNSFAWLYLPRTEDVIHNYSRLFKLSGVNNDILIYNFLNSEPLYESFEAFLADCI